MIKDFGVLKSFDVGFFAIDVFLHFVFDSFHVFFVFGRFDF